MIKIFEKKPTQITAVQWTGSNIKEACNFIHPGMHPHIVGTTLFVNLTKESELAFHPGEWIVRQDDHDYYPVTEETMEQNYIEVKSPHLDALNTEVGANISAYDRRMKGADNHPLPRPSESPSLQTFANVAGQLLGILSRTEVFPKLTDILGWESVNDLEKALKKIHAKLREAL